MTDVPTFTGNEITDVVRLNKIQGDGLSPQQGSTGIWEATTNLVANGGLESNTTFWGTDGGGSTLARLADSQKFGIACGRWTNPSGIQGVFYSVLVLSTSTVYTYSAWLKRNGTGPTNSAMIVREGTGFTTVANLPVTLTDEWVRYSIAFTSHASVANHILYIEGQAATSGWDVLFDGVQCEQQPIATPYVETNGAGATRPLGYAVAPTSIGNQTQQWIAMRIRMGFDSAAFASGQLRIAQVRSDANNLMWMYWESASTQFALENKSGGVSGYAIPALGTFVPGSILTLIGAWDATSFKMSRDGVAFVTTGGRTAPVGAVTGVELMSAPDLTGPVNGGAEVFWVAVGSGTLTDADANLISRFNNDPKIADFPGTPTWFWDSGPDGSQVPLVLGQLGTGRI